MLHTVVLHSLPCIHACGANTLSPLGASAPPRVQARPDAGVTGLKALRGLSSFKGITSDSLVESPSASQERRSSGVTASTSYAGSEAGSGFTDDTAMGTGEHPVHSLLLELAGRQLAG